MFFKNGELDVVGRAGLFRFLSPFSIFFLIPSSFFFSPSSIPEKYSHNLSFFYYYNARKPCLPDLSTKHAPRHLLRQPPSPPPDQRKNEKRRCSLRYDANLIFMEGGNTKTQIGKLSNRIIIIFSLINSFPSFLSIWSKNFFATVAIWLVVHHTHTHTHDYNTQNNTECVTMVVATVCFAHDFQSAECKKKFK